MLRWCKTIAPRAKFKRKLVIKTRHLGLQRTGPGKTEGRGRERVSEEHTQMRERVKERDWF